MLKFVNKKDYWKLLDLQLDRELPKAHFPWHLKSIQDLVAYEKLRDLENSDVAEIGGGKSRILKAIADNNNCVNIEKFEGRDGGPSEEYQIKGVKNVHAFVGEFSDLIPDDSFDVVFSVSVVEHVPGENLKAFIDDCYRILRPGGIMFLVDMYLNAERKADNIARATLYEYAFSSNKFASPDGDCADLESDFSFNESYCTNPDNIMYDWNSVNPLLRELREKAQSCSLIWLGRSLKPNN